MKEIKVEHISHITRYQCGICEEIYDRESQADHCEGMHICRGEGHDWGTLRLHTWDSDDASRELSMYLNRGCSRCGTDQGVYVSAEEIATFLDTQKVISMLQEKGKLTP